MEQEYRDTGIQKYHKTGIQGYRNTMEHAGMEGYRDTMEQVYKVITLNQNLPFNKLLKIM